MKGTNSSTYKLVLLRRLLESITEANDTLAHAGIIWKTQSNLGDTISMKGRDLSEIRQYLSHKNGLHA